MKKIDLSVYVIIDPSVCAGGSVDDIVRASVAGGASMIQLRNKIDSIGVIREQAESIQQVLADLSVPIIVNDYAELAFEIGADGVHIGQEDISAFKAREIIGKDKILGVTAFTKDHYSKIAPDIVDYVGTGPVYPTLTKPDKEVLGVDGFAKLVKDSPVSVVGIGGITPENAAEVIKAGANGVAMMRSVTESENPKQAVQDFVKSVRGARLVHS